MEKEFIPYQQALELKGLGFNEPCIAIHYSKNKKPVISITKILNSKIGDSVSGVTYSQAFRWFRNKKSLEISIIRIPSGHYSLVSIFGYEKLFDTYEEAEFASLLKLIELSKAV